MFFQYIVRNSITEPTFTKNITVPILGCNETVVLEYMQMVADEQSFEGGNDDWSWVEESGSHYVLVVYARFYG